MDNRAVTLSIMLALIAVFFVDSYVSSIEDAAKKKFGVEVHVVTAKNDISEMETINETHISLELRPKRFLEPTAIYFENVGKEKGKTVGEVTQKMKKIEGSIAIVPIKKGEQISYNKISSPGIRTGLSPQVTPGMRAVSVPVNETTSVSKLIKPGDRVDVIAVMNPGQGEDNKISKLIFQDIAVLAVGRNITNNVARLIKKDGRSTKISSLNSFDGFSSITLEVEPFQAQYLALVSTSGNNSLSFALRNNHDTDRVTMPGVFMKDLLGRDLGRVQSSRRK